MEEIIYKHIRNLSWSLLIDSKASSLLVKITPIAELYECNQYVDYDNSRYGNATLISSYILDKFGLNLHPQCPQLLATRLLAPACVFLECNITDPLILMNLTEIPSNEALYRLQRIKNLRKRDDFHLCPMEIKVVEQFRGFIECYNPEIQNNI